MGGNDRVYYGNKNLNFSSKASKKNQTSSYCTSMAGSYSPDASIRGAVHDEQGGLHKNHKPYKFAEGLY
jgi:hypothetical protein